MEYVLDSNEHLVVSKGNTSVNLDELDLKSSTVITVNGSSYTVQQLLEAMVTLMDKTVVYQDQTS